MPVPAQGMTRLVIAGGGTGGHVFPGIAVAEALSSLTPLDVLWIGTGRKVEVDALESTPWTHRILRVRPIKGMRLAEKIRAVASIPFSCIRAMSWLNSFRPHMVLGVGGYVSGPVMLAARAFGIPAAIHEQNAVPGLANRMASRFARMVFLTYPESAEYFPGIHTVVTGNPVRRSIVAAAARKRRDPDATPSLLILGGSQGAAGLNRIASEAVSILVQSGVKIRVVHQTGPGAFEEMKVFYNRKGGDVELHPFIHDMARAYSEADLVLCRAGATTLAEITALGKPSMLIPYPFAADNHQERNAAAMTRAGASVAFRESDIGAVRLAGEIESIITDSARLEQMASAAWSLGKRDAALRIARELLVLAGRSARIGPRCEGNEEVAASAGDNMRLASMSLHRGDMRGRAYTGT